MLGKLKCELWRHQVEICSVFYAQMCLIFANLITNGQFVIDYSDPVINMLVVF